ncbi:MAG TPA: GNAT family N-acetyltransferase [Clostridia bacterium]|nr:GNAT family N-acetyltransferase [Clostridia bacterium]
MSNTVAIKKVDIGLDECNDVIRRSFITVAEEFNITRENAPTNPAFLGPESLIKMRDKGIDMYGAYVKNTCIGFVAIEQAGDGVFYMERLAVLPEYRHNGYGRKLIDFVMDYARKSGGKKVSIGIINENRRLKDWYISCGFAETGTRKFDHLPFEVCFMERIVNAIS